MNHAAQFELGVVEATWSSFPLLEPHAGEDVGVDVLPDGSGIPGAVDAALELGDKVFGKSELCRQLQEQVARRLPIKVSLADVRKAQFKIGTISLLLRRPLRE